MHLMTTDSQCGETKVQNVLILLTALLMLILLYCNAQDMFCNKLSITELLGNFCMISLQHLKKIVFIGNIKVS